MGWGLGAVTQPGGSRSRAALGALAASGCLPRAGWAPQPARHLPWPPSSRSTRAASTFGSWVGKAGGLQFSSRPSPTPTPSLVPLGGGNGFLWDKGAALSPQSTGEALGSAREQRAEQEEPSQGSPTLGVSHGLSLHREWLELDSANSSFPQPLSSLRMPCGDAPVLTATSNWAPGGAQGVGQCERPSGGDPSALHLPGTPLEQLQLLSQPCFPPSNASPQPLGSFCPRRAPKPK